MNNSTVGVSRAAELTHTHTHTQNLKLLTATECRAGPVDGGEEEEGYERI